MAGPARLGLYFRSDPEDYFNAGRVVGFLRQLLRHLRGRVIVVWDGGSNHKGQPLRALLRRNRRLSIESLPAYAPELNPVEAVWNWLKYSRLCNYVPLDVQDREDAAQDQLCHLKHDDVLYKLWLASDLPFPTGNCQPTDQ